MSAQCFDVYHGKFSILQGVIADFVSAATVCQCGNSIHLQADHVVHSERISDRNIFLQCVASAHLIRCTASYNSLS